MNKLNKKLEHYMELPYTTTLQRDDEGDLIARIKEFDGCVAHGQDEMEALGNLHEAKIFWLSAALKAGRDIPLPEKAEDDLPSGKFLARVPRSLHKKLVDAAKYEGVSLNQLLAVALSQYAAEKYSDLWRRPQLQVEVASQVVNGYARGSGAWFYNESPSSGDMPLQYPEERDFFKKATANSRLVGPRLVVGNEESLDDEEIAVG
jgi:antitoxin HicB